MMKKIISSFTLVLLATSLVACAPTNQTKTTDTSASSSKVETLKATFTIKESDEKVTTKEVTFSKDQTVMEVMKKEFKIEEKNGLITSIDGVSQNEATKTYWMYNVNGEMAPKGAAETKLSSGDKVEFFLQTF